MKKIALIMLAVVSMALASCGGGGGNNQEKKEAKKYEPATPAITYSVPNVLDREKIELDEFKGCFEVKNVGVRESAAMELTASATLEVVKDLPEYMYKEIGRAHV